MCGFLNEILNSSGKKNRYQLINSPNTKLIYLKFQIIKHLVNEMCFYSLRIFNVQYAMSMINTSPFYISLAHTHQASILENLAQLNLIHP